MAKARKEKKSTLRITLRAEIIREDQFNWLDSSNFVEMRKYK